MQIHSFIGAFNSVYQLENGTSVQQAAALYDGMEEAGIRIFTIGFQATPSVVPFLKGCATADGTALRQAFKAIGDRLTGLQLTN